MPSLSSSSSLSSTTPDRVQSIIHQYSMQPHPEGGFYAETYRSPHLVPHANPDHAETKTRSSSTGILYLLRHQDFSSWHRIESDEMWHYYHGDFDLLVHVIDPDSGELTTTAIGTKSCVQFVVPARHWFAVEPDLTGENKCEGYALTGCTVSPGFDFEDFVLGDRQQLVELFPQHEEIIRKLTRVE